MGIFVLRSSVVDEPPPSGGAPTPGGGDTIIFDTRAGGANDIQVATTHAQILSIYGGGSRFSGGASGFISTDVDGLGTKARGCQWINTSAEQECFVAANPANAPTSGWYTSFKIYLGRSATGGGSGTLDQWTLFRSGGNAHQKLFLWLRGSASHRIYIAVRPSETKFSIDGLNWNSPDWDVNLYDRTGEVLKITCYFSPDDGVVQAWIDDTMVLDASGQNIGNTEFASFEETVTTYKNAEEVQYIWDTVIWY